MSYEYFNNQVEQRIRRREEMRQRSVLIRWIRMLLPVAVQLAVLGLLMAAKCVSPAFCLVLAVAVLVVSAYRAGEWNESRRKRRANRGAKV